MNEESSNRSAWTTNSSAGTKKSSKGSARKYEGIHRSRKDSITPNCIYAVCMAGAVLLKYHNKHMSTVQTVISLLLNAGHISSQVSIHGTFVYIR